MTAYMLDTNAFNHVLDDNIPVEAVRGLHLLATHVPWDELNATALKNPTRAAALLAVFEQIAPDIAVTELAVWNVSNWNQAKYTSGDGVFERMSARLSELDKEAGKKHRDPLNPTRDALIAETAIKIGATFVTGDQSLRSLVVEFGGRPPSNTRSARVRPTGSISAAETSSERIACLDETPSVRSPSWVTSFH